MHAQNISGHFFFAVRGLRQLTTAALQGVELGTVHSQLSAKSQLIK